MESLLFEEQLILKLLDGPFLLIVGIAAFVYCFRKPLGGLISRGGLTITWGDKSFSITELPEELDESFSTVTDDIEDLKQSVAKLEKVMAVESEPAKRTALADDALADAKKRMLQALEQGNYRWRSIERLASTGAVTDAQAETILRPLDEVVFSHGKSGRTIVRLKTR